MAESHNTLEQKKEFSNYGKYVIEDELNLELPYTSISFKKESEKKFAYDRIDSQDSKCSKIITTKSDAPEILLVPITPNHQPSNEANHILLKFDREIMLEHDSTARFNLNCPIEIGIYLLDGKKSFLLDSCTCEPMHSRFAIYGDQEEGILCKYMEISTREVQDHARPFVYAKMSLEIVNQLKSQTAINKIIIPVQNLRLFYNEQFAATNKISYTIKDTTVTRETIADINSSSKPSQEGWQQARVGRERKNTPFLMDKGLT